MVAPSVDATTNTNREKEVSKERPILFSGPMVRAILEGRKTQTRRVVKPQPPASCYYDINGNQNKACCMFDAPDLPGGVGFCPPTAKSSDHLLPCPYGGPGDRLWVRETWFDNGADWNGCSDKTPARCVFRADGEFSDHFPEDYMHAKWSPSIHMPRWASRITLEVKAVRVERLNDISEDDAIAEGVEPSPMCDARDRFCNLWVSVYGDGSFDANPWVWVVEFERVPSATNPT